MAGWLVGVHILRGQEQSHEQDQPTQVCANDAEAGEGRALAKAVMHKRLVCECMPGHVSSISRKYGQLYVPKS